MAKEIPPLIEDYGASPIRGKINHSINQIRWVLGYMHDVQEMRLPAVLDALAEAKKLRRYASALERTFDDAAVAEMQFSGQDSYVGDGFVVSLRSGGDRKEWQSESLVNEIADRFVSSQRSKYPDIPLRDLRRIVQGSMDQMVAAGRTEWRSTSLRSMGIDPDEFSVKPDGGGVSVDLRGAASYVDEPEFLKERPTGS